MNTPVIGPGTITSFPGTATPEVPADWDFDKSVDVMATRMRTWKSLTAEILTELYVAREILSKPHSNNSGWADYCKAIGVPKRTANRWLRRALMAPVPMQKRRGRGPHGRHCPMLKRETIGQPWNYPNGRIHRRMRNGTHHHNCLDAARDVLGEFDLDPASSDAAQRQVQATEFFDKNDDGLTRPWRGRVWLNPPYSQPAIGEFVSKLVAELYAGHVRSAVMLTHNYTDTAWFHEAQSAATAICFTRGRVKFVNPAGETAAPTQGQAFFYFGSNPAPFVARFSEIGFVVPATWVRSSVLNDKGRAMLKR